jgi:hypothetical protein
MHPISTPDTLYSSLIQSRLQLPANPEPLLNRSKHTTNKDMVNYSSEPEGDTIILTRGGAVHGHLDLAGVASRLNGLLDQLGALLRQGGAAAGQPPSVLGHYAFPNSARV